MRKRLLHLAFVLLVAAISAAGAWTLLLKPVEVQVATIEQDVPIQVFGLGTIEAQVVSQVGFETAGTLVELLSDHGDSLEAGALLARLDSREQDARLAAEQQAAIIAVTHDEKIIGRFDRIFRLRDGRLEDHDDSARP